MIYRILPLGFAPKLWSVPPGLIFRRFNIEPIVPSIFS